MKQCNYKRRGKSSAFCMLNYWPLTIRSRLIVKYSADNSMPTYLRPDSWQATPVEPPPINGSSTVLPGCVMASRSRMSATGLLVRWTFWAATTGYEYRPGKQDREGAAKRPLEPKITNSFSSAFSSMRLSKTHVASVPRWRNIPPDLMPMEY